MTQLYASFSTNLLPFISVLLFTDVALACQHTIKTNGVRLSLVSAFLGGLTAGQQAVAHNISNRIFKSQITFHNYFLAYVSSHGSGGGGGGGGDGNAFLKMSFFRFKPNIFHFQLYAFKIL